MSQNNYSSTTTNLVTAATLSLSSQTFRLLMLDRWDSLQLTLQVLLESMSHFSRLTFLSKYGDTSINTLAAGSIYGLVQSVIAIPSYFSAIKTSSILNECGNLIFSSSFCFTSLKVLANAAPVSLSNTLAFNVAGVLLTNLVANDIYRGLSALLQNDRSM